MFSAHHRLSPPADPTTTTPSPDNRSGLPGDAPGNDGPPISPLIPGSMHRADTDPVAFATSPEFHERPTQPGHTAPAATHEPPRPPGVADDDDPTS